LYISCSVSIFCFCMLLLFLARRDGLSRGDEWPHIPPFSLPPYRQVQPEPEGENSDTFSNEAGKVVPPPFIRRDHQDAGVHVPRCGPQCVAPPAVPPKPPFSRSSAAPPAYSSSPRPDRYRPISTGSPPVVPLRHVCQQTGYPLSVAASRAVPYRKGKAGADKDQALS